MAPDGPLHPELFAVGLAAALIGILVTAGRPQPQVGVRGADRDPARGVLAGVGMVSVILAIVALAPAPVVVALGVSTTAGLAGDRLPSRPRFAIDLVAAGLLAMDLARRDHHLLALVPLLLLLVLAARRVLALPLVLVLAAGSTASTWAGAPDTEVAVLTGGFLAGAIAFEGVRCATGRRSASSTLPGPALWLLVTWAAANGYRGRPIGVGGAVVGLLAAATWLAVGAVVSTRPNGRRSSSIEVIAIATSLAVAVFAARTVGLDGVGAARPELVLGLALAAAAPAGLWGVSSGRPGFSRGVARRRRA